MALAELTDSSAVEQTMDEFDRLGRDAFLQKYRYGRSRNYFVERNGTLYDSKAIVGVAYGVEHPDRGPLRPDEFSGGDATVRRKLEELGFSVHSGELEALESFTQIMASVLELQESYSSSNTPEMQLRGRLIRQDGPKALRRLVAGIPASEFPFDTEGRDGTGLKTRVPWMRIFTKQYSPRATTGWYVVFLFATDGSAVYLSLNQGTTTFEGGDFRGRPSSFLQERVTAARELVAPRSDGRMLQEITLHDPGGLGQGYEQGNVFAYRYEPESLPDDEALQHDLQTMLHLLELLYASEAVSTEASTLAQVLQRVLELQPSYSSDGSTPEMQLRGQLLKHDGPRVLQPLLARLPELSFEPEIIGGDGTSRKARVPFILVTDGQRSSASSLRWYVTYLFAVDGSSAYLSLNLGSPRQDEGKKLELPLPFRRECVIWARSVLSLDDNGTEPQMDLRDSGTVGPFFQQGSVTSVRYNSASIPDDARLEADLQKMLEMLDVIYKNEDSAPKLPNGEETDENPWETLRQETLWSDSDLTELVEALQGVGRQVVLAGPPGTGKTRVARAIARFLTANDPERTRLVQFHPSYGYEEFVEGLRPTVIDGAATFGVQPGVVKSLVNTISEDDRPYVLVIDEMNRANLPRVFGELMYLLEYRDEPIDLQYSQAFRLPKNLLFIGTMNTADRSIRSIDIALRRRFEIFDCPPNVHILERFYESTGTNHVSDLFTGFVRLNEELSTYLDKHHAVGHSYFLATEMTTERLRRIWKRQIGPLIEEYFFDQPDLGATFVPERFWQGL